MDIRSRLLELDKEFAKSTAEMGLEGWVSYFDEDGAMVPSQGEVIKGKDAVRNAMAQSFALNSYSLKWEPEYAEASEDGSLGYTYGRYVRTYLNKEGNIIQGTGRYTTIWKRQSDNSYKIILDMGN